MSKKTLTLVGALLATVLGSWMILREESEKAALPQASSSSAPNAARDGAFRTATTSPRTATSARVVDPDAENADPPLPSHAYGDGDQPHDSKPPTAQPSQANGPAPEDALFDHTPVGRMLADYFTQLFRLGPDAEKRAKELLEKLKQNPTEAVAKLDELYRKLPPDAHTLRETTVQTLSDLGSHEALESLNSVLQDDLPFHQGNGDPHAEGFSPDEGRVRFAALEGLEGLAMQGNGDAEAALEEMMVNGHPTLRHQAVVAYVHAGPDPRSRQAAAAALLHEEDRWMVNTVVMSDPDMPEFSPEIPAGTQVSNRPKSVPGAVPASSANPP
jgi:hypothetical protein